jgi:hypothetical protein
MEPMVHIILSYVNLGSDQTPVQRVPGALSSRIKRQWREADHSPPSTFEVPPPISSSYNA